MKFNSTIVLFILLSSTAWTQTQTPVYLSQTITNANSKGFYQYVPRDYANTTKTYPLIIWVHGAGQIGQGNTTDLPKILEWGVPKIISQGGFPESFRVNGVDHSFIVISPQFMGWPSAVNVAAMISYVSSNYRVDPDRIYLMGISAGGGGIWDYASASVANSDKIAAMIPFCGTTNPTQTLAGRIAASKLPVWAFHNTHDGTVPVEYSRNWVNYINSYVPAPTPAAKLTEFPVQSNDAVIAHECWSLATLPSYKPEGINIYEWMLQYKRRTAVANAAPVARAGNDASVVLPATLNLNGSASTDADGMITAYRWRKLSGPATHSFSDSTAANTAVSNLSAGTYQFELRVTDNGGATATDNITVTVYAASSTGTTQRVLIDIGAGPLTTSPSINGLYWNNLTDGRPGIRVSNAVTTSNAPSGINVEVINRLDGTYSISSSGLGTDNTTGTVNDYPASATTDYQFIHSSATNGLWRISGMDASKVYTIKFWGSMTGTSPLRIAEIKRADETTWKSYSATSNTDYNNAAVFIISGQTSMDFNIRTKSGSDFTALCVIDISYGGETQAETLNNPPVANAGANASITLPTNTVTVSGAASTDADGSITSYSWRQVSGAPANISSPSSVQTGITFTTADTYRFELTVTDNRGGSAKDSVDITVSPAPGGGGNGDAGGTTKTFRVNIYGGSNPYNSPQWNNWNMAGSLTSAKFNYDDGTASNVSAVITSSALIADNGATYASAATACPAQVLRYTSANTSYRTLTFNGMASTRSYNLEFYASRANTGNSTIFQIGNKYDTVSTDNNLNDIARFTNIVPDNNGSIIVTINRIGTWNYLSGFVITENADNSYVMSSSRSAIDSLPATALSAMTEKPGTELAMAEKPVTGSETLVLYPNPGTDIIYLNIPAGVSGPYKLNLVNMKGQAVMQKTGTKGNAGFTDQINISDLPKGMYLLKVWIQNKNMSSTIIKL